MKTRILKLEEYRLSIIAILAFSLLLITSSCDNSSKKNKVDNQTQLTSNCDNIKARHKSNIVELDNLSNLEVLNGIKWLSFSKPFSYYKNCVSNINTFKDYATANVEEFDFLGEKWEVSIIAYKGEIIKISLYSGSEYMSLSNSVRNDFIKLLGNPNISNLILKKQVKEKISANIMTLDNKPLYVNESSSRIRTKLKDYHIEIEELDEELQKLLSQPSDYSTDENVGYTEKVLNLDLQGKVTKGHFDYYKAITFEDVWKSKIQLNCIYERTTKLEIKDAAYSGSYLNNYWLTRIDIYKDSHSFDLVKLFSNLKKESENLQRIEENNRSNKKQEEKFKNQF